MWSCRGGEMEGGEGQSDRGVPPVIHLLVSEGDVCPPLDAPTTTTTTTSNAMDNRYAGVLLVIYYLQGIYICILL